MLKVKNKVDCSGAHEHNESRKIKLYYNWMIDHDQTTSINNMDNNEQLKTNLHLKQRNNRKISRHKDRSPENELCSCRITVDKLSKRVLDFVQ